MRFIFSSLNWFFGVLFLLMGFLFILELPGAFLLMVAASFLLLPPIRKFVYLKTKKEIPIKLRGIALCALIIFYVAIVGGNQTQKEKELAAIKAQEEAQKIAAIEQQKLDEFKKNSVDIINNIEALLANGNYEDVIDQTSKYSFAKNKEIRTLEKEAKEGLAAQEKAEKVAQEKAEREAKTKEILVQLQSLQESDYEQYRDIYQELSSVNPDNLEYKEKISFYAEKIKEQEEEKRIEQKRKETEIAAKMKAERDAKAKAAREARTKEILAKLRTVPASQYQENKDLYQQLVAYYPNNENYQEKLKHYSDKLQEQKKKELIEKKKVKKERETRIATFGEPPTPSPWDGSYRAVKRYLEKVANDPDSIEIDGCTEVYHTKDGWLVGCNYRGRNAFGGMVRQANWFTIIHGNVVQMHDYSTYNP